MLKDKILAALRAKYKEMGFTDKDLEGILPLLEATITSEDQIAAAVDGMEGTFKAFQGVANRWVSTAVAKKPTPNPTPEPDPSKPDPAKPDDQMPAWAKALVTKIDALEQGKSTDSRKQTLTDALKDVSQPVRDKILKDFGRMSFATDEDFTTYLEETKTDVGVLEQTAANNGLGHQSKPILPAQQTNVKTVDADIVAWAKQGQPAPAAVAAK